VSVLAAKPLAARAAGRRRADQRRVQIVEAAVAVFAGRPFEEVHMDEVAERAGVSKALLYKHFPGKRELYLEAIRTIVGRLRTLITETVEQHPRHEHLGAALAAYTHFANENRDLFLSLYHTGSFFDPAFSAEIQGVRAAIEDLFLKGLERTPQLVVGMRGVIGFVDAATMRWLELSKGAMNENEIAYLIETMLRCGLDHLHSGTDRVLDLPL
jgi:AcrR family transcriptional regulator